MISDQILDMPTLDIMKQEDSCKAGKVQTPNWAKGQE